jgi:hypothetical protein
MTAPCLHFKPLDLLSRSLMLNFVCAQEDFLFLSLCTLRDLTGATSSLRIDMTSSPPLRLHVDRGLRDMGTHGSPPTRIPEVPVKWTQPARSPADLQVGPETLSTIPVTLEYLR